MATITKYATFILSMQVWSDPTPNTNYPVMRDWSWVEQLTGITLSWSNGGVDYQLPVSSSPVAINIPRAPALYLFVKSDQPIALQFNGQTGSLNTLNPTTPGVTQDADLFMHTSLTSLSLVNLGTAPANVIVWMGG